jgi:hypothetical protein
MQRFIDAADACVRLAPLPREAAQRIAAHQVHAFAGQLRSWRGMDVQLADGVLAWVVEQSHCNFARGTDALQDAECVTDATADGAQRIQGFDGNAVGKAAEKVEGCVLDCTLQTTAGSAVRVSVRDGALIAKVVHHP